MSRRYWVINWRRPSHKNMRLVADDETLRLIKLRDVTLTDANGDHVKWNEEVWRDAKVTHLYYSFDEQFHSKSWSGAFYQSLNAALSAYAMKFLAMGNCFGARDEERGAFNHDTLPALKRFMDLIPMPRLRKRVLKLLADQVAHIGELREQRRSGAARWIEFTTWVLAVWYVFTAPVTALWNFAFGRARGAGD